jgi:hypothetical protein
MKSAASNEYEIVTDLKSNDGAIIVSIILGDSTKKEAASIKSAYPRRVSKNNNADTVIRRINDDGRLVYVDLSKAKAALTGRINEKARISGPGNTAGGVLPSTSVTRDGLPTPTTAPHIGNIANNYTPVNENFVGWRSIEQQLRNMIANKQVKTDMDLLKWIGNNYKPESSPQGWRDVPSFSRAGNAQTAAERADALLAKKAATWRPVDSVMRGITKATRFDKATGFIYNQVAQIIDRYTPEQVKAGVVSDYGVPEAVIDRFARRARIQESSQGSCLRIAVRSFRKRPGTEGAARLHPQGRRLGGCRRSYAPRRDLPVRFRHGRRGARRACSGDARSHALRIARRRRQWARSDFSSRA